MADACESMEKESGGCKRVGAASFFVGINSTGLSKYYRQRRGTNLRNGTKKPPMTSHKRFFVLLCMI